MDRIISFLSETLELETLFNEDELVCFFVLRPSGLPSCVSPGRHGEWSKCFLNFPVKYFDGFWMPEIFCLLEGGRACCFLSYRFFLALDSVDLTAFSVHKERKTSLKPVSSARIDCTRHILKRFTSISISIADLNSKSKMVFLGRAFKKDDLQAAVLDFVRWPRIRAQKSLHLCVQNRRFVWNVGIFFGLNRCVH